MKENKACSEKDFRLFNCEMAKKRMLQEWETVDGLMAHLPWATTPLII